MLYVVSEYRTFDDIWTWSLQVRCHRKNCQSMEGVATCKYKITNTSFWHKIGITSTSWQYTAQESDGEYNSLQETH